MKELKQLKEQYLLSTKKKSTWFGESDYRFIFRRNDLFRCFSTKQEKALSNLHHIEYAKKYGLKLRSKRLTNLLSDWDDISSSIYSGEKTWKINSKRKHQYYRIKNI